MMRPIFFYLKKRRWSNNHDIAVEDFFAFAARDKLVGWIYDASGREKLEKQESCRNFRKLSIRLWVATKWLRVEATSRILLNSGTRSSSCFAIPFLNRKVERCNEIQK